MIMNDPLHFSGEEIELVERHLGKSGHMLEWGAGGSTIRFSQLVDRYYSIEHDRKWYDEVNKEIKKREILNVRIDFVPPNLDQAYDYALDAPILNSDFGIELFKDYINHCTTIPSPFDFVLIDGRARKHCILKVLPFLKKNSLIFFHDFNNRSYYHEILDKEYKIVDKCDTLAVLSPSV